MISFMNRAYDRLWQLGWSGLEAQGGGHTTTQVHNEGEQLSVHLQENVSSSMAWCCTKQQCARRYPREGRQKHTN